MLTYCCTKSNKLSLIIKSLPAAKSIGCLQQSLQGVYPCKDVVTICLHDTFTCTCSIQLEYYSLASMAPACFLVIWNKAVVVRTVCDL